jgi:hypothetical protein
MRHVLIVCYDFPLISGAGVIRTYQFAKRLPEFGWHPVILTAQVCGEERVDNIEISDGELPCSKITAAISRFAVPVRIDHRAARKSDDPNRSLGNRGKTCWGQFAANFAVPDGKIGWMISAVKQGMQITREYPVQACFSVSPRPTAHFVAYRLAQRLNIPWVADFALPWSDAYWLARRPSLVAWLDQRMEAFVVRAAQRISVAYPDLARSLAARHGAVCEDKIAVVPTGFDEELFVGEDRTPPAKFTVVYPGNHFCEKGRDGEFFLRAVDEWISFNPGLEEKVEFLVIGKRDEELLHHRAAMKHPKIVRLEPLMSHRACIQAIRSSHLCVVNTVGNRIPGKVYECMRAGKWILALTDPGSDLENLIRDYSKRISLPPQDMSAIRNALQSMLQRSRSAKSERSAAGRSLPIHSSNHSAERFSHIFEDLLFKPSQI